MRIRLFFGAGSASYRRSERLESLLSEAEAQVGQLRAELEADPAASTERQRAARERAAREQLERTHAALERMKELEAQRARREKSHKTETQKQKAPKRLRPRMPQARVMHMPDGGYRPAYNGQFASDPRTQVIVAVGLDTTGSDGGLMAPMQDQIVATYGQKPHGTWWMVASANATTSSAPMLPGIEVFAPPPNNKHQTDPFAPRERLTAQGQQPPGASGWASEAGKAVYRERGMHECINAHLRNCGVVRLLVRGRQKRVRAVLFMVRYRA